MTGVLANSLESSRAWRCDSIDGYVKISYLAVRVLCWDNSCKITVFSLTAFAVRVLVGIKGFSIHRGGCGRLRPGVCRGPPRLLELPPSHGRISYCENLPEGFPTVWNSCCENAQKEALEAHDVSIESIEAFQRQDFLLRGTPRFFYAFPYGIAAFQRQDNLLREPSRFFK